MRQTFARAFSLRLNPFRLPLARPFVETLRRAAPYLPVPQILPDGRSIWRYFGDRDIPRIIYEIHVAKVYDSLPGFGPKDGETVIDVGAHIGIYVLRAAQRVGRNGLVVAVEADPKNFALLTRNSNILSNNCVIPANVALWNRSGNVVLHRDPSGFGGHSVVFGRAGDSIRVKAETLDCLVRQLNLTEVSLIKLDVEGAALDVLRGGIETVIKWKPRIVCAAYHTAEEAQLLGSFLRPLGYHIKMQGVRLPFAELPEAYLFATPI